MAVVWDVTFSCPKCEEPVRYQSRFSETDLMIESIPEGLVMNELLEENKGNGFWCSHCETRIGFVKKIKVYLEPVIHDSMPKDPTPDEIARVQAYLARQGNG